PHSTPSPSLSSPPLAPATTSPPLLFSSWSGRLSAPQSSPTRRSSDLDAEARHSQDAREEERVVLDTRKAAREAERRVHERPCGRSEEHTSELQSRYHIVCRPPP